MSRTQRLLAVLALCCAMPASPALAQDELAVLQRQREALLDSMRATQERLRAAEMAARAVAVDSVRLDGVLLRYDPALLPDRDRQTLAAGIARARRHLADRYGRAVSGVLDGDEWTVAAPARQPRGVRIVHVTPGSQSPRARGNQFALPLDVSNIERLALQRAGALLTDLNPVLRTFASGAVSFARGFDAPYLARRQLVASGSSPARRCVEGAIVSCRDLLNFEQRSLWYDPADQRPPGVSPMAGAVRASLVLFALESGGDAAVERLSQPPTSSEPLPMLASAAGLSPEAFLAGWVQRLPQRRAPLGLSVPLLLSSSAWALLLAVAATRRRPR